MNLSIVIPAYNEAKRIRRTLIQMLAFLNTHNITYEIIIVDDGSTDTTLQVVRKFKGNIKIVQNKTNLGKGFAVKTGIEHAKYDLILFSDADLATPIGEVLGMIKQIDKGHDVVIASRNLPESTIVVKQSLFRQILGKTFPLLVKLLLVPGITDTQCGFKLFTAKAAKRIVKLQTISRFSFDVELLFIARKLGFKVAEVPVTWTDQKGSTVNPLRDGLRMLVDLVKIRVNQIKGKYTSKKK
ncbi:MAG: dolichyl-phosphate beta-glucosyltransferase [Candidatus Woesearchaeota archaeon]|jgi:dolichyl-phosphate beta-glucosyltransferase